MPEGILTKAVWAQKPIVPNENEYYWEVERCNNSMSRKNDCNPIIDEKRS
jgi:hypothetical protein